MPAPVVFFDIAGPDGGQLRDFYTSVFGWVMDDKLAIDPASTGGIAGTLRQDPAEKILYLGVSDINATLAEITKAGGQVDVPRMIVPGVVTFALFRDPAGNRMGLVEAPA